MPDYDRSLFFQRWKNAPGIQRQWPSMIAIGAELFD